jgi:hypothetical protein
MRHDMMHSGQAGADRHVHVPAIKQAGVGVRVRVRVRVTDRHVDVPAIKQSGVDHHHCNPIR